MSQFQEELLKIQKIYQERIQESISLGRVDDIHNIVAEMETEMNKITALISQATNQKINATMGTAPKRVFENKITNLNLDNIAYAADLNFFKELPERQDYLTAIDQANKDNAHYNARRSLLTTAMRLTENVSKHFFQIVDRCRETLNFNAPMEIFVVQDSHFNAAVMPMIDDRVIIFLTSSLVEKFSDDEIAFVLGHEMGHAMFGHVNVPVNILMGYSHLLSGRDLIKLKSWQRGAELSADRAGLLCSQDYNAACSAFFKLSSGITSEQFKFNVEDYMGQYADLEFYLKNTDSQNVNEVYSSHPLNPIRLKALSLFKSSETYSEITKKIINHKITKEHLEAEIKSFMDIMEPNYLDDDSKVSESIREFMFLSGYMIASANGVLEETEINQISSLVNDPNAKARLAELEKRNKNDIIQDIYKISGKLMFDLSAIQRTNIARDLFVVVTADGSISTTEIDTMHNICNVLAISPYFIEDLIRVSNIPVQTVATAPEVPSENAEAIDQQSIDSALAEIDALLKAS